MLLGDRQAPWASPGPSIGLVLPERFKTQREAGVELALLPQTTRVCWALRRARTRGILEQGPALVATTGPSPKARSLSLGCRPDATLLWVGPGRGGSASLPRQSIPVPGLQLPRDATSDRRGSSSCLLSRTGSHALKNFAVRPVSVVGKSAHGLFPEVVVGVSVLALELFGFAVLEGLTAPNGRIASSMTPSFPGGVRAFDGK